MAIASSIAELPSGEVMDASDPARLAAYIEEMTGQLVPIAQRGGMDFLAYLLEMARMEAEARAKEPVFDEGS